MNSVSKGKEKREGTHVHNRELRQDLVEPLFEGSLGELDLAHVCRKEK
jgi:hypothetical protein